MLLRQSMAHMIAHRFGHYVDIVTLAWQSTGMGVLLFTFIMPSVLRLLNGLGHISGSIIFGAISLMQWLKSYKKKGMSRLHTRTENGDIKLYRTRIYDTPQLVAYGVWGVFIL